MAAEVQPWLNLTQECQTPLEWIRKDPFINPSILSNSHLNINQTVPWAISKKKGFKALRYHQAEARMGELYHHKAEARMRELLRIIMTNNKLTTIQTLLTNARRAEEVIKKDHRKISIIERENLLILSQFTTKKSSTKTKCLLSKIHFYWRSRGILTVWRELTTIAKSSTTYTMRILLLLRWIRKSRPSNMKIRKSNTGWNP